MDALAMWGHLLADENGPSQEAIELYRYATDLTRKGRWSDAVSIFEGCLDELEKAEAPQAAPANHAMAVLLQQQGDRDGAVFHCVRAVYLYEAADDLGGMYAGLRNLVVVHRSREENQLAMAAQGQAARVRQLLVARGELDRVEQGRDRYGESLVLLAMAAARAPRPALVRTVG
jgi:tetratricopeptide (TPR) repeat protein